MKRKIAISIVIPVYNIENYLEICLDSILAQTFEDYEIICVNDGSKDNSLNILNKYSQKNNRIKVINQENSGSGSARNNGLRKATGKYIQFLDGDDYFEPEMLKTLYNLAEENNADIAVCSSRKVDDEGNITETKNPNSPLNLAKLQLNNVFNYKDYPEDIFNLTGTIPWNKLYLRNMLVKNSLKFPSLTGPDDFCFVNMANVCAKRIIATNSELINYRYNRPGSVQTYRANHTIDIVKAGLYIKEFLKNKNLYNTLEKAYFKMIISAIRWETTLCNEEQYTKFLKELKELLPEEWEIFSTALRKKEITIDYLNNLIGNRKVYLWGASNYIRNILEQSSELNPNILGIIDKNEAAWNKNFVGYKIYSPQILKTNPADILVTVYNNTDAYYAIKEDVSKNYSNINVLENIF